MLPWVALLIKLDSRGPVFYRCDRVGLNGKIFRMFKFRTMYETKEDVGPKLSPMGDPRVTSVGQVLRRLKLNEFPQFINVLMGDMTLIGPRPEAPELAAMYPKAARKIFSVKPGLAGPNQILGRNEEEDYPPGEDPVKYYINHILPRKLPLDLQYIEESSIFKNLKYLFLSVVVTLTGAISRRHLVDNRSQIFLLLSDIFLSFSCFAAAHFIKYGFLTNSLMTRVFWQILPWAVLVQVPIFLYYGFYNTLIRYLSLFDIKTVFKGVTLSSIIFVGVCYLLGFPQRSGYGREIFVVNWSLLVVLLIGYRIILKKIYVVYKEGKGADIVKIPVLVWGAGDAGEFCVNYLRKQRPQIYEIVGFLDDDPRKRGKKISGVKIMGNRDHLKTLKELYKIQSVFVAIHSISDMEANRIIEAVQKHGLQTNIFRLGFTMFTGWASDHKVAADAWRPKNLAADIS